MILLTKPQIKYLDRNKLHVSRRPRSLTWLIFSSYTVLFVWICQYITRNSFVLFVSILGEVIFCLDILGDWEDFILNRETNKAIISKYTWTDKLCFQSLSKKSIVMELTDIRYVGVSIALGLFIVHKSGQTITVNMNGLARREIQNLRKEINYFLNMCWVDCLDCFQSDPFNQLLITSNSEQEYMRKLCKKYHSASASRETLASSNEMKNLKYSLQQNLSSPLLGSAKDAKTFQHKRLKKGPYTENNSSLTYSKSTLPAFVHSYDYKTNLKIH